MSLCPSVVCYFPGIMSYNSQSLSHFSKSPQICERPSFSPPAARQLNPSGWGSVCGLFIKKKKKQALFHTQLDVCGGSTWRSHNELNNATMNSNDNKTKWHSVSMSRNSSKWRINSNMIWCWAEKAPEGDQHAWWKLLEESHKDVFNYRRASFISMCWFQVRFHLKLPRPSESVLSCFTGEGTAPTLFTAKNSIFCVFWNITKSKQLFTLSTHNRTLVILMKKV